jgi:hypothetical protein
METMLMDTAIRFFTAFGGGIAIATTIVFLFFLVSAIGGIAEAYAFAKGYGIETSSYVGSAVMLILWVGIIFGVVAIL